MKTNSNDYLTRFAALFYLNGVIGLHEQKTGIEADVNGEFIQREMNDICARIELQEDDGTVECVEISSRRFAPVEMTERKETRGRPSKDWSTFKLPKGEFTARDIGSNNAVKLISLGLVKVVREVPTGGRGRPTKILIAA